MESTVAGCLGDPPWKSDLSHSTSLPSIALESLCRSPHTHSQRPVGENRVPLPNPICTLCQYKPQARDLTPPVRDPTAQRASALEVRSQKAEQTKLQAVLFFYLKLQYLLLIPANPRRDAPSTSTQPNACVPSQTFISSCRTDASSFPRVRQHVCRPDCNPEKQKKIGSYSTKSADSLAL